MSDFTLVTGDCREVMRTMAAGSVHTCVTSPPYFGLRDYGVDGQLGLERTPAEYVANMVEVFRHVRRVLRDDGTLWLNIGDSYAGSWGNQGREEDPGLKAKDLIGIPWALAKALRDPYYAGRITAERDRVWLAATIDAEGTICGFRHERPDKNVRTGILTFITNSDARLLDNADRIWQGARYQEHNKKGDDVNGCRATRDCWRWQIQQAEERSAFLREIYPYLISKRTQALLAWNVLEFTLAAKRMGRGGETDERKERRNVLVGLISRLNHGEDIDVPNWCKEPPSLFEQGYYLRSDVIWNKSNPMPESVTDRPTKSHEYIFLFSKQSRYFYDAEAIAEPVTEFLSTTGKPAPRSRYGGLMPSEQRGEAHLQPAAAAKIATGDMNGCAFRSASNGTRNRRSVWTVATQPFAEAHFATFPEALIEPCILAGSPIGGTVLDPFTGSGTTGVVAIKHGRNFVGIELKPEYVEMSRKRIGNAPLSLFAQPDGAA